MNTLITLPNNLKYYPQDGLSPLEINSTLIGYGKDYDTVCDNTDKILSNVTLREINQIADDYIDSNLEKGKEKDLDWTNALNMALL